MRTFEKTILVTGGAGFIGSNLVLHLVNKYPKYQIINADALTYAGNLNNLKAIESAENYCFEHVDVSDTSKVQNLFEKHPITHVLHLAAESHVDRSIQDPLAFVRTNIYGTVNLLHACRLAWNDSFENRLFYHISTDEVYGSLSANEPAFDEGHKYDPHSPYSASKAGADHFVRAFHDTFGLPVVISNCSNNYGPLQFPEKLIPLTINNILNNKSIPIYGNGTQVRDWLYVQDHVEAIDLILHHGAIRETYNIGGNNERQNIDLVREIIALVDERQGKQPLASLGLLKFVTDRPGHDTRYSINPLKIERELGWKPRFTLAQGLQLTIDWYLQNKAWLHEVTPGEYRTYYDKMYGDK